MRYVGIFLMAGAAAGGGFYGAKKLSEQLEILLVFRQMVYHLKSRILHANDTLPEALMEIGEWFLEQQKGTLKEPGRFFVRVAERLYREHDHSFSEIWKEELARWPTEISLRSSDKRSLEELGENLGYADRDMQERTLLFYLERTDDSIAALKRELETKAKLYRYLGVAAGLFLIVVLI